MNHEAEGSLTPAAGRGHADVRRDGLAELSPAYFAMVMATGIVSIAAHLQGLEKLAVALLWLNIAAWIVLWILNVLRIIRYPARVFLAT